MIDIEIISGTDRPDSNSLRISYYLQKRYREFNANVGITDLKDFPLTSVAGGKYGRDIPEINAFIQPLMKCDGLVIVCPEYNGGYPGILKLFIDYLPFPESLYKKPICFVGEATGSFGGLRAVEQLQQVVGYRNAHVFPERVFISRVHKNFDPEKGIKDSFQQELLEDQIKNYVQFLKDFSTVAT